MTVSSTTAKAGPTAGNGVATSFPFDFKVFAATDLQVVLADVASGAETILTLDSDYSVTLNPDQDNDPGGSVTYPLSGSAMTNASTLTIVADLDIAQPTDITNGGGFYADVVEKMVDRTVMLIRQMGETVSRALKLAISTPDGVSADLPAPVANSVLGWNEDGTGFKNFAPVDNTLLAAALAAPAGASLSGYLPSGVGAEATTLQTKNRESMSNLDFIPDAEKAAILAGTSTYDATAAVQKAIDAAGSTRRLRWLGVVNCGALSSNASVDWVFDEGAKIVQIPAVYGLTTFHVTLSGPKVRIENYDADGNQSAMISTQGSNGLLISGVSPTLINPKSRNYNGLGIEVTSSNFGARRGLIIGGGFDDNANLGMQTQAASYVDFLDTTFCRNGYGFQKTRANYADTSHGFVAFGAAIRLRSHHLNFIGGSACDNGRDGVNVNQGSYAIKFNAFLAYGNDDGGFTIASDDTGSGLPGEGEACYDIEYADCESYNNYTGGLVAYDAAHNVTVRGGRYYNNHRLAGNLAFASSYFNGIFFAGGSTGINVDTKAYDDRQTRAITAVTGSGTTRTLAASGWVAGTMDYYPKVAIYDGNMAFLGYGQITAESAGSVTIETTANNGVNLADLVATQYVSQNVQHNGLFADNASTGQVHIDGYGHKQGPAGSGLTGFAVLSGYTAGGQNICLPKAYKDSTQLLTNPTFDADVLNWTFSLPGGGAANYYTGTTKRSAGALQLVAGTSDAVGDSVNIANSELYVDLQFAELNIWAWAEKPGAAYVQMFWGGTPVSEIVRHPGGGTWKLLKISAMIPSGSANFFVRLGAVAGNTVYFDSADLHAAYLGQDDRDYAPTSRYLPY